MAKRGVTEAQAKAQATWQARKEAKVNKRIANQEARAKRSPQEQLERLDKLLGVGLGARKERARLLAQIEKAKNKKEKTNVKKKKRHPQTQEQRRQ